MTHDPNEAAERLATVLKRENSALAALDLRGAAAMLAEKQAGRGSIAGGAGGWRRAATIARAAAARPGGGEPAGLEHAIAVQRRIIGLIARALRSATPPAPRYGATGAMAAARVAPVTLSARA